MADCDSGDLDSAVAKLRMALLEARKIGVECYQAKVLNNLGIVFEMKGDTREARQHYQRALGVANRKLGGDDNPLSRAVSSNLARVS